MSFQITDRDGRARNGQLHTSHGTLATPAFVPLATKGSVRTLTANDVRQLGYEMVLGNTFHLYLQPTAQMVAERGGLHNFMRWDMPIITDSGGFQVFSMGHGTVADEIKGRSQKQASRSGTILSIQEEGVKFRSYIDGSKHFMSPEISMQVQAQLGSNIALVFDECTPFHVTRQYTQRSTDRTHRWLERCLRWHREQADSYLPKAPEGSANPGVKRQLVYGIVQGGVYDDLRVESAQAVAESGSDGIAIGGSLGQDKEQMYQVVDWTTAVLPDAKPRHLLGIGDIDDLLTGVELGIDTFDCAMPTRLARHGCAIVADPHNRWRVDLTKARFKDDDRPISESCSCPTCSAGYSRAYLRYLNRIGEGLLGRLITLHNLHFIAQLMADLRSAIAAGKLTEAVAQVRDGAEPGALKL